MADFQQQKEYCQNQSKDIFYKFFEIGHCYMESCFECNYRTTSAADLRIGIIGAENIKMIKQEFQWLLPIQEEVMILYLI